MEQSTAGIPASIADRAGPTLGPTLGEVIARVALREDLDADGAEAAFREVMEGRATPVQVAALLMGLRVKGEVSAEVAGGVRALRAAMVGVPASSGAGPLVDTCGTGGGTLTTFNISTAAALVAAGAGVRVAKHGNRSFTSGCGSADVLAELGVTLELTPESMARVLDEAGIVFMFAPLLHPAMRHAAPVRREMGVPTIMNVLGPLTNPAGARRQVVGVADPRLVPLVAGALQQLGHEHALVAHGEPGLDELSPIGHSDVIELKGGQLHRFTLDPADTLGCTFDDVTELAGGGPEHNARIVLGVLRGEIGGAARAAVVLNAAAALYVAGHSTSLASGVEAAQRTIDSGEGLGALERLRTATHAAAARAE